MKGLSIEQKAKRYDEAFERVKELLSRCRTNRDRRTMVYRVEDIESIFPEVKKSEDEKIKEDLIQWISDFPDIIWRGHYREDVITWLKKQGEQKQDVNVQINPSEYVNDMGGNGCYLKNTTQTSTWSKKEEKVDNQNCVKSVDDVKPKFKVGDWISNDMCDAHIASIEDGMYYFDEGDGLSIVFVDEHYHLWTIEDAMDGDVLFHSDSASNGIFIFKEIIDKGFAKEVICYCDYDSEDHFCLGEDHTCCWSDAKILYPATKEQCDLLFSKIKEAGYEWDSKKKELKIIDWSKHIKYEKNSPSIIEENTMWGEEDEDHLNSLIDLLPGLTIRHNWLKSLKDRIQHQPKQEWSDEDEYMLDETIQHLKQLIEIDKAKHCGCDVQYYQRDIDWLKSLRPHKQWKPSEEQMSSLRSVVNSLPHEQVLFTLYNDLKKLKGE